MLPVAGKQVAVKTLKVPRGEEALQMEAERLCKLDHLHIVRIFGYCTYVARGALLHRTRLHGVVVTNALPACLPACVPPPPTVLCCSSPVFAIVMEFVAWGSLSRWATANRGIVTDEMTRRRVGIAQDIASGMAFIHANGCVVCPLSPQEAHPTGHRTV